MSTSAAAVASEDELSRVLMLPSRAPLDCERDGARRWSPAAQALVEVVTERFARPRFSCGCRERRVAALGGGRLLVYTTAAARAVPPLPLEVSTDDFLRDSVHDRDTHAAVAALRPGQEVILPGLGYPVCLTQLNPAQAWMLKELPQVGGVFGMISVGGGKTIMGLLAPLAAVDCKTVVLLAKPDQRLHYRDAYLRLREHFRVPSIVFDSSGNGTMQGSYIVPGAPVLHFLPYSLLSNPKSSDLLDRLNPDMVVADESHCLASKLSARTMRFLRFLARRNEQGRSVVLCTWSGTTVKKSLADCCHLAAFSLGLGSPLPIRARDVDEWSAVVDPSPMPDSTSSTARDLRRAFGKPRRSEGAGLLVLDNSDIREGLRARVLETHGVISTWSSSVTASLSIVERKAPPLPLSVRAALADARLGLRPDGEEIVEAKDIAMCARAVGAGYYHYWAYPKATDEERSPGGLIDRWFAARKPWNKELRAKLLCGEVHLDSPKLCEDAAERAWCEPHYEGPLPVWTADNWPAWAAIRDLVEPEPRVRWIDDFLARDAAAWALEHCGIVWCQADEFGQRVAEILGLPYHAGGPDAEARILAEDGRRPVIASIKAHGTGRDRLQHRFSKQLVAEMISSGDGWQQLLGRLVREGQQADTVETFIYRHVEENREAFRKALMYAEFIQAQSNQQLLLSADIEFDC